MDICNTPEVLKAVLAIKRVFDILKVLIPVLLIVVGIKEFYTYVVNDGDNLKEVVKKFIIKIIIALSIIFIPTFILGVLKNVNIKNTKFDDCITNATEEGIQKAYINKEKEYVENVKEKLTVASYRQAVLYLKNIDDVNTYKEIEKELEKCKEYIDLVEKINTLTIKNYSKLYKELEEDVDSIADEKVKERITNILELRKKEVANFIGEYPVIPFGEYELYTGLTYFENASLEDLLAAYGMTVEELNERIKLAVETAGVGTREASVAASITLIGTIAETGYRLPYFWGGKRNKLGVDGSWGLYKNNSYCNDYYFKTEAELDHCKRDMSYWGMDCSGFVNWAVTQALQKPGIDQGTTNGGKTIQMDPNKAVCTIGDALGTSGHIVLVVGIDEENKRYIIAEESSGLEIRSVPFNGNRGGKKYYCIDLSHNYVN